MGAEAGALSKGVAASTVAQGLQTTLNTMEVGHGFADIFAGYDKADGIYGKAEAGYRIAPSIDAYAYGQASTKEGFTAGLGARWTF